jgi:hypothetical protein
MRNKLTTVTLAGLLTTMPVAGFVATAQTATTDPASETRIGHSTTSGVVKSIDDKSLTITRSGKNAGEMAFALERSTKREGTVAIGAPVSVRFDKDGKTRVATAVVARLQPSHTSYSLPPAR